MICKNCGSIIKDNVKECPYCLQKYKVKSKGKSISSLRIIGGLGAGLIVIIIVAAIAVGGNNKSEVNKSPANTQESVSETTLASEASSETPSRNVVVNDETTTAKATTEEKPTTTSKETTATKTTTLEPIKNSGGFILNTKTKKVHISSCRYVSDIDEDNKEHSNKSIEELKAEGYSACGNCKPW
ncbi:MAG: hypothetical protein IKN17_01270 [Ruminococcus sp.]|nr:hypothetical protein [Ruminococcus sp.]